MDIYQFSGGAHGITKRYSYNIDTSTGKKLNIDDIVKTDTYKDIVNSEIENQIKKNEGYYFEGTEGFSGISNDSNFFLDKDSLIIYFQEYEISPYSTGIPEFKIPLTMIK